MRHESRGIPVRARGHAIEVHLVVEGFGYVGVVVTGNAVAEQQHIGQALISDR